MGNIITASLSRGRMLQTQEVFQYGRGQILRFVGRTLPHTFRVDFSNSVNGRGTSVIGSDNMVLIPDRFFDPGKTIYAWVVIFPTENSSEAEYQVEIPVSPKAYYTGEDTSPSEQDFLSQIIAELNSAVSEAETAIEHYPVITNGYWYIWDVDAGEYVSTGVLAQGPEGDPGDPGFSPVVTVTEISGGHEVTITDANGDHTFDVMDGTGGGGTGDYSDLTNKPSIESVTLSGNKTASDLGLAKASDLSGKQAKITASGILKGDGNGGVSSATAGTDYGTYSKPSGGIPASDLASAVQTSLGKADSAYQKPGTGIPASDLAYGVIPTVPSASSSTPQPLGTAAVGSSGDYARADHVHAKPTAADVGAAPASTVIDTVSGSTPSITGVADHRYVCGEVSTLSIQAPASGCIDVVFESGSTATVLTVTSAKTGVSAIKWANGFDPTSLDANTVYEINILDGEFGVVGSWT